MGLVRELVPISQFSSGDKSNFGGATAIRLYNGDVNCHPGFVELMLVSSCQ